MLESRKIRRRDRVKNLDFEERVVHISRVTKVVRGGRIFSFSALVIIGNKTSCFGIGMGKARDVSEAKRKAINDARNNLYYVYLTKNKTVPHEVRAKFGATRVLLRPAKPGTGIIAGGVMRMLFDCLGVKDVVAKIFGSCNHHNVVKATRDALVQLRSKKYFTLLRSKHDDVNDNDSQ